MSNTLNVLTIEQEQVLRAEVPTLKVEAFAGTGKTTTLVAFAKARPNKRFLYIAFNKAIQMEAERKFPSNVKARTTHSLAFAQFGNPFFKAGKLVAGIKPTQMLRAFNLPGNKENYRLVADVMETVNNYMASADPAIGRVHLPGDSRDKVVHSEDTILSYAKKAWEKMCDLEDASLGMVHDGYLKLYQLSRPVLNYDYILFDEAQDANPVTTSLVMSQTCRKVFVGDTHQQIYSFRGAHNALEQIRADATLYLTQSFRFGSNVAITANAILSGLKGETRPLIGMNGEGKIGPVDRESQYAVISRTNALVLDEAISAVDRNQKIHFVGGVNGYNFDKIEDTYNLYAGRADQVRDAYVRSFGTFSDMEEFAEEADDKETKMLCRVVRKYGDRIPNLLRRIRSEAVDDMSQANIVLTTAHKSKGLEFDQVILNEDFMETVENGEILPQDKINPEEVNLVYVAATRAMKTLQPYSQLGELMTLMNVSLQEPVETKTAPVTDIHHSPVLGHDPERLQPAVEITPAMERAAEAVCLRMFGECSDHDKLVNREVFRAMFDAMSHAPEVKKFRGRVGGEP